MKKDSVIFYYEWLPLIASLANASKLKFFEIFTNPDMRDIAIDDDPHLKCVVDFIKIKIAQNEVKYEKTIEARKLAGSKGGKQKLANASNTKQKVANVAVYDNVNVNVNVNDKVKVNLDNLSLSIFSPDELGALTAKYPAVNFTELIETMKYYCLASGKKYKDYKAALNNWAKKEQEKQNGTKQNNGQRNNQYPAKQSITDAVAEGIAAIYRGEI